MVLAAASSTICSPRISRSLALPAPLGVGIVAPGFLLPAEQYTSYAHLLSSFGLCAQVVPDRMSSLSQPAPIGARAAELLDAAETQARRSRLPPSAPLVLVGHSRGAKACCVAASMSRRPVAALILLDPVDVTPFDSESVLQSLATAPVPTAVLGAARGADCAPVGSNYEEFYTSLVRADAMRLLGVLPSAGHMQFVDDRRSLGWDVCAVGKSPDAAVHDAAFAMIAAWVAVTLPARLAAASSRDVAEVAAELEMQLAAQDAVGQDAALQLARAILAAEPQGELEEKRPWVACGQLRLAAQSHRNHNHVRWSCL